MLAMVLYGGMVAFGLLLIYDCLSLAIRVGLGHRYLSAPFIGLALCAIYGLALAGCVPHGFPTSFLIGAAVLFLVGFCAYLIGTLLCVQIPPRRNWSYVVVLGAALRQGRIPSPLLRSRLEVGRLWWQLPCGTPWRQARRLTAIASASVMPKAPAIEIPAGGDEAARGRRFVVCGGQGPDELVSEAQAMRTFLVEKGVPASCILLEDLSRTTQENLVNAKRVIDEAERGSQNEQMPTADRALSDAAGAGRAPCLVVTNDFHALRTWLWARRAHLDIAGVIGKPTRFYYLVGSLPRDYLALLKGYGGWVALAVAAVGLASLLG